MSGHHPHHEPVAYGRAFAIGVTLNLGFVLIEAWYGWRAGSLALLADAGHNLSDVGGLLVAWAAMTAVRLKANDRHSYGWQRGSILASFTNALVLLVAMGALAWEALERLTTPTGIEGLTVIVVAAVGMLINALTAWLFLRGSEQDLNIRGAFLHMAADALVSAGVVVAGLLYLWQGWSWLDPVVSLLIALVIIVGTWSLFRRSLHLLFDGVPDTVDLQAVSQALAALPGVVAIHDLHIWALSTTDALLHQRFGLHHATLQIETTDYAALCHSGACGIQHTSKSRP